jgi:transcription antitermination factor NusG
LSYIVVTAEPSKLRKVRRRLRRKGYTAYLPAIARVRAIAKGSKVKRKRHVTPLMSYIFVQCPDEAVTGLWLYDITETKDVRAYVKVNERAALVSDEDVSRLAAAIKNMRFVAEANATRRRLRKGDSAKAKNGAFTNHTGTVLDIKKQMVEWETYLFGRPTTVRLKATDLEKVQAA